MFYDTEIKVIDKDLMEVNRVMGDIQPYDKVIRFEDDIELEVKSRLFCDLEPSINDESYLLVEEYLYKVMDIKRWSDYLEILLYECSG